MLTGKPMPSEPELLETSSRSIRRRGPLEVLFRPRNVAVIGATEEQSSVGRSLLFNLQQTSFGGSLYPVNPRRSIVLGLPCYPSIGAVSERVDLAVIATPARTVPGIALGAPADITAHAAPSA